MILDLGFINFKPKIPPYQQAGKIINLKSTIKNYLVSLCGVCFLQERQNLFNSKRCLMIFLFFLEL
jgi:hypothetical protein